MIEGKPRNKVCDGFTPSPDGGDGVGNLPGREQQKHVRCTETCMYRNMKGHRAIGTQDILRWPDQASGKSHKNEAQHYLLK